MLGSLYREQKDMPIIIVDLYYSERDTYVKTETGLWKWKEEPIEPVIEFGTPANCCLRFKTTQEVQATRFNRLWGLPTVYDVR